MTDTPRYALQLLANNAGNVQRVNEALLISEAFLGGALVLERDRLVEPVSPDEGDMYLLPGTGTLTGTNWATLTNGNFALFVNAAWVEITVDAGLEGCKLHVQEERVDLTYHGASDGWRTQLTSYDSGNQTITASALLTLAHGLGAIPDLITYTLVCLTAEHNYSVNDEVDFSTATITRASSTQAGLSVRMTATQLLVRYGSDAKVIDGLLDATTGGTVNLTPANWALKIKAYIL